MTTSQTPAWPNNIDAMIDCLHRNGYLTDSPPEAREALKARLASPELPAERARLVDAVFSAVWACGHKINSEVVALHFDPRKPGHNALNQLRRRIEAALAALPAPTLQADTQAAVGAFVIEVEKLLCAKLGREWSASGISIVSLIDALAAAPTLASVQPVAVRWEQRFARGPWFQCDEEFYSAPKPGYEVRALGVIDPTPAERGETKPVAYRHKADGRLWHCLPANEAEHWHWEPLYARPQTLAAPAPQAAAAKETREGLRNIDIFARGILRWLDEASDMLTAYAELVKMTGRYAEEHYIPEVEELISQLREAGASPQPAPAREGRQPLTEDEIVAQWKPFFGMPSGWIFGYARAIEAAHGIGSAKGDEA
jgi:hypothetical protein